MYLIKWLVVFLLFGSVTQAQWCYDTTNIRIAVPTSWAITTCFDTGTGLIHRHWEYVRIDTTIELKAHKVFKGSTSQVVLTPGATHPDSLYTVKIGTFHWELQAVRKMQVLYRCTGCGETEWRKRRSEIMDLVFDARSKIAALEEEIRKLQQLLKGPNTKGFQM